MRVRRELTQEGLAELIDMERSYTGAIERGEHNITLITILKLADALNCEPAVLLADVKLPRKRRDKA